SLVHGGTIRPVDFGLRRGRRWPGGPGGDRVGCPGFDGLAEENDFEGGQKSMNLYQCPKCGREAGIAEFIKKVTVICRCGSKMVKVATGTANSKGYMQLRLFG